MKIGGIIGLPIDLTRLIGSFSTNSERCLYSWCPDYESTFGVEIDDNLFVYAAKRLLKDPRISIPDNAIQFASANGHHEVVQLLIVERSAYIHT